MDRLLVDQKFLDDYGERLRALCDAPGLRVEPLTLPEDPQLRLDAATLSTITLAGFTGNWEADPVFTRRFFGSLLRAERLRWMHVPNAGIDNPVFSQLLAKGVRMTTSAGASAEPIAHTVIGGVLALARGFPQWWSAQQQHVWRPLPQGRRDLRGQTMVIVGVGAIGNEIARLARALGLTVIGIRRSAARPTDQVDELYPPAQLPELLRRADWLVLACPLTAETRGMIGAQALSLLRPTACVINVGRGQVIDERVLIDALREQRLGGAYLDVFTEEPLEVRSPLWDLPNVILSPHDSAGSSGNRGRVSERFLHNLERWAKGEALQNEVHDAPVSTRRGLLGRVFGGR